MIKKTIFKINFFQSLLTISTVIITGIYLNNFALKSQAQDASSNLENAGGEESPSPGGKTGQSGAPTTEELFEARAIKLSIVNSVIDFVGNAKRARLQFQYDLLTAADNQEEAIEQELKFAGLETSVDLKDYACGVNPLKIEIPNELLGQPDKWQLEDNQEQCLLAALGVSKLKNLQSNPNNIEASNQLRKDDSAFDSFWNKSTELSCVGKKFEGREGCGYSFLITGDIPVSQYISMRRERNVLKNLLRSQGVAYRLDFDSESDIISPKRSSLPRISYEDITWEITINEKLLKGSNEDERIGSVAYYRISARAKQDKPVTLLFRGNKIPEPRVTLGFRDSSVTSGLEETIAYQILKDLSYENLSESLSPQVQSLLKTLNENNANTQLEEGFTSFTGNPLSQVISRGILGGTEDTSIVTGGLVGSGEVQTLVGANSEFRNIGDFVPGVLFGIGPGGDNSTLFIGPSLRYSIFTIALGARFFDFDNGTRIREGGVISVDLSRVTGGKPTRTTIKNSSIGGGWDKVDLTVANDISKDTVILNLEVVLPNGLTDEEKKQPKIILFQKTDSEGRTIKDNSRAKYEINSSINELRYLPLGKYGLNFNLPEGYQVIVKGDLGDNKISSEEIPKDVPPKPQPSPDATAIAEAISSLGNSEMPEEIQEKKSEPNLFLGDYTKAQFESLKLVIEKK